MAEEKNKTVKIKLGEDWHLAGIKLHKKGETVEVDSDIYESMKLHVKHEVVK